MVFPGEHLFAHTSLKWETCRMQMSAEIRTSNLDSFVHNPRDDVNGARMYVINEVICVYLCSLVVSKMNVHESRLKDDNDFHCVHPTVIF